VCDTVSKYLTYAQKLMRRQLSLLQRTKEKIK